MKKNKKVTVGNYINKFKDNIKFIYDIDKNNIKNILKKNGIIYLFYNTKDIFKKKKKKK